MPACSTSPGSRSYAAESWFAATGSRFATRPVIQGSPIGLLIGEAQAAATAGTLVRDAAGNPRRVFWPDDVPCLDVPTNRIVGYRPVTDACLGQFVRLTGSAGQHRRRHGRTSSRRRRPGSGR
jgi:hypothetical protein